MDSSVHFIEGDAADEGALRRTFEGAEKLFLAMANGPEQKALELRAVAVAREVGIRHIVKVSAPVVGPDVPVAIARMHFEIEQAIERSAMGFSHLRPYGFMQNTLALLPSIRATGTFFGAAGDAPLNRVDARDVADVAVFALTKPEPEQRAYVVTGPEAMTHDDLAERISALGRPVRYIDLGPDAYRAHLRRQPLPDWLVEHLVEIELLARVYPEMPNDTVLRTTGHPPRTTEAFLRENAEAFLGPHEG
ncbi:hypothetical protein AKJ09_06098 [Labilithrix luteola]|uniref:NmrA-like domain-containing protein n=1 Tax=Labilithrix luteola TaxID=1391654 RepID=A0A0K1Q231_9BACT|nr:hypothetical protein AKJ09_06098 [Labilithrix luteola]